MGSFEKIGARRRELSEISNLRFEIIRHPRLHQVYSVKSGADRGENYKGWKEQK
jgi:hypothetical protein